MLSFADLAQRLVEQAPDAMIFADKAGGICFWNAAAERIFGFSGDEALGKSLNIVIPEDLRNAHWRGFHRALTEGRTKYAGLTLPTRSLRSDGTRIYVELSFAIILDTAGTVLGALAQARDITERFTKERALRKG